MSFSKIKDLFEELAGLDPVERSDRLNRAEVGEETRTALRRLLDIDAAMAGDSERLLPLHGEAMPARIGPFAIEGIIGEGGMGRVYRASREVSGVRQPLAIKVVRRDRLDAASRARFQLERQVLAMLQHPNIASMVDTGETIDGQPYLALEFIEGQHITDYARSCSLDSRARVQLFRSVASAVAYAHRNLIVHRDLKPSNVLVDRNGIAKVIDFGIAKPLMGRIGDSEVNQTQTSHRYFSLHSAAPEQLRGGLITPSCDLYGLGALLYELLTGTQVFDLQGKHGIEIEKTILEREPEPPSARVVAAQPGASAIDPDLDAIALMCLRKRPEDRYGSVDKLIEDLDAWLDERPVSARNGNGWYRLRRLVRRNRRGLVASAIMLATAALAIGLTTNAYLRSTAQSLRADQFANILVGAILAVDPGRKSGIDITAQDLFRSLTTTIRESPDLSEQDRADLQQTLADVLYRLRDFDAAEKLMTVTPAPDESDLQRYETYHTRKAALLSARGKYGEAENILRSLLPKVPAEQRRSVELSLLRLRYDKGDYGYILSDLEALATQPLTPAQEVSRLTLIGDIMRVSRKFDQAITQYQKVLALTADSRPDGISEQFRLRLQLSGLYALQGNLERAQQILDEAKQVVDRHYTPESLVGLTYTDAVVEFERVKGNHAKALRMQHEFLANLACRVPADSRRFLAELFDLAQLEHINGNRAQAYGAYEQTIAVAEHAIEPGDPQRMLYRVSYAARLAADGDMIGAGTWVVPALQEAEQARNLKALDAYPLALALQTGGEFSRNQTSHNRAAFVDQLRRAHEQAQGIETRASVDLLLTALKAQGFEIGPAPADSQ